MVPGRAEEGRRLWIPGAEIVSDWCQRRDEAVVPIRQRKNIELAKHVLSVGDGGEKPVKVFLVDSLREESDYFEEVTRLRAEAVERWGSKREFHDCCKALVVICLEHLRMLDIPLLRQSVVTPPVVRCGGSEQRYGKGVKI